MINKGNFQKPIVLTIGAARQLWMTNKKSNGSIPSYIINIIEAAFGRHNLDFQPQRGDILESPNNIIMFNEFTDWNNDNACRGVKVFFSYDKKTGVMTRVVQPELIEVINGFENDYIYATDENKKLFFENMNEL